MARYVKFPGLAGSYASTDDVNILDADTAHVQQSIGLWTRNAGNVTIPVSEADSGSVFGDNSVKWVTNSTGNVQLSLGGIPPGGVTQPLTATTEYSVTFRVKGSVSRNFRWFISHYDVSDVGLSSDSTAYSPMGPVGVYAYYTHTWTTPANATQAYISFQCEASESGDVWNVDVAALSLGPSVTFVPSLRIVGDLDIRCKGVADELWGQSVNTVVLGNAFGPSGFRLRPRSIGTIICSVYTSGVERTVSPSQDFASGVGVFKFTYNTSTGDAVAYWDDAEIVTNPRVAEPLTPADRLLATGADTQGNSAYTGDIYYATVRDGIDGPVVASFDADDIPLS